MSSIADDRFHRLAAAMLEIYPEFEPGDAADLGVVASHVTALQASVLAKMVRTYGPEGLDSSFIVADRCLRSGVGMALTHTGIFAGVRH